jgi:uncharacterized membrane protein HdeD (DUF308 family)
MVFYSTNAKLKHHWLFMILWSLVILMLGIYILVDTHDFAQILAWAFGIYQLVSGVFGITIYIRLSKNQPVSKTILWQGILRTLVGLLAIFLPILFVRLSWMMMLYLLATQFLISAVMDFSLAWRVQHTGFPLGVSSGQHYLNAVSSFIAALILFVAPRFIGLFLLNLISILLILIGSVLLVTFTRLWWREKKSLTAGK